MIEPMEQRFRIHDLRKGTTGPIRGDLAAYLRSTHLRLHNTIHAETRVYTCRSWRATLGATQPYELHWNDTIVPGETLLGTIGRSTGAHLQAQIEAELSRGDCVRLFIFNSDADLCFEDLLMPAESSGGD